MLENNKLTNNKAYSLVAWVSVFTLLLAALLFIRMPFKRALQHKINSTADYMFWTKWGGTVGEKNDAIRREAQEAASFSKTQASQNQQSRTVENRGDTSYRTDSGITEDSISSGVEDGSQPVLRTFDINAIVPD